jgi:hypothetical protein
MLLPVSGSPSNSQIDGRDSADTLLVYRERASDVDHEDCEVQQLRPLDAIVVRIQRADNINPTCFGIRYRSGEV